MFLENKPGNVHILRWFTCAKMRRAISSDRVFKFEMSFFK